MNGNLHRPGDLVGERYRVEKFIDAGGMQEVYLANDTLLEVDVALKSPKNETAAKRFRRSAVVSARVNHANVAKTLDFFEQSSRSYLVEELIEGSDFSKLLKRRVRYLDPFTAASVLHRLARGLAASHRVGVVHRDLKPSNVMSVGGERIREIKITDFGIAKMAEEVINEAIEGGEESLTSSQTAIGAVPYMAPEMIQSFASAGPPADVWSLGAMMFELLTGKKPFGQGFRAIPLIQQASPPSAPAFASKNTQFRTMFDEIWQIILTCMRKDASQRPTAEQLVVECGKLCYPSLVREKGIVARKIHANFGFIHSENGDDVFFHNDSVYGDALPDVSDAVWFSRHKGTGADRAFPVVKA